MYRIDGTSAAPTIPTPAQPGTPGYFTNGNPTTGTEATIVDADFMNAVQEELSYVIESAGLTLSKTDRTQLAQALARLGRLRLQAPLDLYVSNTGSDLNTGLTPSTAFASLQRAWNYIRDHIDLSGYQATIHVADGTHAPLQAYFPIVGPAVWLIGNNATPGNVVISNPNGPAISVAYSAALAIQGVKVQATSGTTDYLLGGSGILASTASNVAINNIECGPCTAAHLEALSAASISFPGPGGTMVASGNAGACCSAGYGGSVTLVDGTVTLVGGPTFNQGFVTAFGAGVVQAWGATFVGPCTGNRYALGTNGCAITSSGNPNFFPGSAAGVLVDPSGVYT